jgi:hypothetical protein
VRGNWREAGLVPGPAGSPPAMVWIHRGSVEEPSMMVAGLEPFFGRVRALFPDTRGHGPNRSHRAEVQSVIASLLDTIGVRS